MTFAGINTWPLLVLLIGLAAIVLLITRWKLHPFIALIGVGVLTGGLAEKLPGDPSAAKAASHWVRAVELTVEGFGKTASKIGVVIALASVIGVCLVESGGADKIVRRFLALFGEERAPTAIFAGGLILSIPIFFETYFMLLLPLAQALHLRTRKQYMLYVMAVCCGGSITHSLVAPHPGPLAMAENLRLDVGQTILAGMLAGLVPATCGWLVIRRISTRMDVPLRDSARASESDLQGVIEKSEEELPSLFQSLLPILLPISLIGGVSIVTMTGLHDKLAGPAAWLDFLGERHIALLLGALAAMRLLARRKGIPFAAVSSYIGHPFAMSGVVILIASAGGAFGYMLKNAGVGEVITALARHWNMNLVLLSWSISAVIRVAQGSATVAMITTSAIMYSVIQSGPPLPFHPIYIFFAIGFGSKFFSWMNDAGFWTVSKFGGFTEAETLRSWSVLVTVMSITGLIETLVLSRLLPFVP
jgi:gluconate:H+ symporter, GntP family